MITILKDEKYRKSLIAGIHEAKKEILIAAYIFDYHGSLSSRYINAVVQALAGARRRDVKVWILLNQENPHSRIFAKNLRSRRKLEKKGPTIKWAKKERIYHAKFIIIDSYKIWIGSHNLSESSLCRNFEISLRIRDLETAELLRGIFLAEWYR